MLKFTTCVIIFLMLINSVQASMNTYNDSLQTDGYIISSSVEAQTISELTVNSKYNYNIQTAVNACPADTTIFCRVVVPAGTYAGNISIQRSNISVIGYGAKIVYPENISEYFAFSNSNNASGYNQMYSTAFYDNVEISGLEIDGKGNTLSPKPLNCTAFTSDVLKLIPIQIYNTNRSFITNNYIHNFYGSFAIVDRTNPNYDPIINKYAYIYGNLIKDAGGIPDVVDSCNQIAGGIYSTIADTYIEDNTVENYVGTCLDIDATSGWMSRNTCNNVLFNGIGIYAVATGYNTGQLNILDNIFINTSSGFGDCLACPTSNVKIKGNIFLDRDPFGNNYAISTGGNKSTISENMINWTEGAIKVTGDTGCATCGIGNASVNNNYILDGGDYGIFVAGEANIRNNYIKNSSVGIELNGTYSYPRGAITGNTIFSGGNSVYAYNVPASIIIQVIENYVNQNISTYGTSKLYNANNFGSHPFFFGYNKPATASNGDSYFNQTSENMKYYNGSAWRTLNVS